MTLRQHITIAFAQPLDYKKAAAALDRLRFNLGYNYEQSKALVSSVYPDLDYEDLVAEIDRRESASSAS